MREIREIIIHCSDSDNPKHDNPAVITEWHVERGFDDIGYHFVITKNGAICRGRSLEIKGAHCKGHNSHSIGICLTGRYEFSSRQFASLRLFVNSLCEEYGLTNDDVHGHCEFSEKTCPNFDVKEMLG